METYSFRIYNSLTHWIPDNNHPQGSNVTVILKLLKCKNHICATSLQNKASLTCLKKKMYINKITENRCYQILLSSLKEEVL